MELGEDTNQPAEAPFDDQPIVKDSGMPVADQKVSKIETHPLKVSVHYCR